MTTSFRMRIISYEHPVAGHCRKIQVARVKDGVIFNSHTSFIDMCLIFISSGYTEGRNNWREFSYDLSKMKIILDKANLQDVTTEQLFKIIDAII